MLAIAQICILILVVALFNLIRVNLDFSKEEYEWWNTSVYKLDEHRRLRRWRYF